MTRLLALVLALSVLSLGCATGLVEKDRVVGQAIGAASLVACQPVSEDERCKECERSCLEIRGATISEGGASVIGSIVDAAVAVLGVGRAIFK